MTKKKRVRPGWLEQQVTHAVNAAAWVDGSGADAAAVWAARYAARDIDQQSAQKQTDLFGADAKDTSMAYRLQGLLRNLNDLGLTPKGRRELGTGNDERQDPWDDGLDALLTELAANPQGKADADDRDAAQ